MTYRRLPRVLVAALALAFALGGCSLTQGLYGVSLPGSVGGPVRVVAYFDNVSDLVPQSSVKVADVTVGTVEKITLAKVTDPSGQPRWAAKVVMQIQKSAHLPSNTVAILQQTSLLGEKFVELGPPAGVPPAAGFLSPTGPDGAITIQYGNTTSYPDIEAVFGALSFLLNGGGLGQLETIDYELSQALTGREASVRDLLHQLNVLLGGLNTQKSEIVRALNATEALSSQLEAQRQTIATALDELGPGLKVLADERDQLVGLLSSLSNLGVVATRVINASQAATTADFADLKPIVARIAAAGSSLPRSLDLLLDYPFPLDSVAAIPGDYTALYATVLVSPQTCAVLMLPINVCPTALASRQGGTTGRGATGNGSPLLPTVSPLVPTQTGPVAAGEQALERLLGVVGTP